MSDKWPQSAQRHTGYQTLMCFVVKSGRQCRNNRKSLVYLCAFNRKLQGTYTENHILILEVGIAVEQDIYIKGDLEKTTMTVHHASNPG